MRCLHTSDWHLGRQFHGASLLETQAEAMDRIVALAAEAQVDAVLIAGDLYDRAIPPAEAVQLFNDTLARLSRGGASVVAIAGNHDSHVRVSIYDPLLSSFGVTIRGDIRRSNVLVTPRRGGQPVAIYPLPYLDPAVDAPFLIQVQEARPPTEPRDGEARRAPSRISHQEITRLALDRIRVDRCGRPDHRSIVVAHAFVAGGEGCESER